MLRSDVIGLVELICSLWLGGVKVIYDLVINFGAQENDKKEERTKMSENTRKRRRNILSDSE
jgi:hypothetical protein